MSLSEKYSFIEKRNSIDSADSVCIAESVLTFTVKREKETGGGRRQGGQAAEQTPAEKEARGGDHDLAVMSEYSSRGRVQAAIIMGCFNCINQVIFTKSLQMK